MERHVVITGLGAVTPVGNNVKDYWHSLVEGRSGIGPITSFDTVEFASRIAGEVKDFDVSEYVSTKQMRRMDRFVQFALASSIMAYKNSDLNFDEEDPYKTGVLIGSGIGSLSAIEQQHEILLKKGPSKISPFLIPRLIVNMASGQVSMHFGVKGPNYAIVTACASGNHAIGEAFKIIQRQDADIMIAGGTESCITPLGLGGFCSMKALSTRNDTPQEASRPFDKERDGFVMAEGAGIVILEELEHAKKRGARIYAEVTGYGLNADAYHITTPDPTAVTPSKCMQRALKDAKRNIDDVDYINAHGTSTPANDRVETKAIKILFKEKAKKILVSSTKSVTGHLLGAAGGIEFIASVLSIHYNVIPPTINYTTPDPECDLNYVSNDALEKEVNVVMSNSLGFGGHNACLLIEEI